MRCAEESCSVAKYAALAAEVYDRASSTDIGQALHVVGKQLLPNVLPNQSVN
jgi:uncharacterized protein with von Willebrand factor type A (vWA) domain